MAVTIERQGLEAAEARAAALEQQLRESQQQAAAYAVQAATSAQQPEQVELAQQRQRISDLYASFSWRVTGPLRSLMSMFRSRLRR